MRKIKAFTLAEVLITLGIIGVVAALTVPVLTTKINNKITSAQNEVIKRKLVAGLNMLSNRENGLNVTYNNTEEFVRALAKYMKMVQICDKNNLTDCFPYEKINYEYLGKNEMVDISSLTSASKLKLNGNWLDPAGFIMADGTPFIISYNNDCASQTDTNSNAVVDPDKPLKDVPAACIDGIYDINGSRTPNKYANDVLPLFAARIGKTCLIGVNNKCLISTPAVVPTPNGNDYWGGARDMCTKQGMRLPTEVELTELASYLYNTEVSSKGKTYATLDKSKIPDSLSGFGTKYDLWSSDGQHCASRLFYEDYTSSSTNYRNRAWLRAFCIED